MDDHSYSKLLFWGKLIFFNKQLKLVDNNSGKVKTKYKELPRLLECFRGLVQTETTDKDF